MVNYTDQSSGKIIAYLTADDLIDASGVTPDQHGEPIHLEYPVDEIRLTKDAGEMLDELSPRQIDRHLGQWE